MLLCPHHQPRDWLLFNFFLLSFKHRVPQREDCVEQALPCHSPICTRASSQLSTAPPLLHMAKPGRCQQPAILGLLFLLHSSSHGSELKSSQTSPFTPQMPREPRQSHGSSHVSLGTTPPSQPASQMMRGIITGPRHREILMGLARISSPSTHAGSPRAWETATCRHSGCSSAPGATALPGAPCQRHFSSHRQPAAFLEGHPDPLRAHNDII